MKAYVLKSPWKKGTDDRPLFLTKEERTNFMITNGKQVDIKFEEDRSGYLKAKATILKGNLSDNDYLYFNHDVYGERFYFIDESISNANTRMSLELTTDVVTKNITYDNLKDNNMYVERCHFNDWVYNDEDKLFYPNTESKLLYVEEGFNYDKQIISDIRRSVKDSMAYLVVTLDSVDKSKFIFYLYPDKKTVEPMSVPLVKNIYNVSTGLYQLIIPIATKRINVGNSLVEFNYEEFLKMIKGEPSVQSIVVAIDIPLIQYNLETNTLEGNYYGDGTKDLNRGVVKFNDLHCFISQYEHIDDGLFRIPLDFLNVIHEDYQLKQSNTPTTTAKEIELINVGALFNGNKKEFSLLLMKNELFRLDYNSAVPLYKTVLRCQSGFYADEELCEILEGDPVEIPLFNDYWKQHLNDNRAVKDNWQTDLRNVAISTGVSATTGALFGGASGAALSGASSVGSGITSMIQNEDKRKNLKAKPQTLKSAGSIIGLALADNIGLYTYTNKPLQTDIDNFNDYINLHGMKINHKIRYKPHLISRTKFCYFKPIESMANYLIDTPLANELEDLNSDLMTGIRFWVNPNEIGNTEHNNQNHYIGGDY